jgi:hypothetical protein
MAGSDGKAPVFEIIREGVLFARSNFTAIAPAAVAVTMINAVAGAVASIEAAPDALAAFVLSFSFLAHLSFTAFVLRLAVHQDRSGLLGLKLGAEEGRVLLVSVATAAVGALIGVIGLIVVSSAVGIAAQQSGVDLEAIRGDEAAVQAAVMQQFTGPNAPVLWLVVAAFGLAVAWFAARLAVAPAATIGERRMLIFSTFPWTRGNAFRIIAALAPFQILAGLLLLASMSVKGAPPMVFAADFLLTFVQLAAISPAMLGATAYLYKGFRPPDFR